MVASGAHAFRWRSWLGLSVVLFLLYGAVNVVFAIFVPASLHAGGAAASGGLIVSVDVDSRVLGRSLESLPAADPGLNAYLVTFMDTMCMMMMAFGLLQLAVAWFALRAGQAWALWSLAIADVSFIPYFWLAIPGTYASFGVPVADVILAFGGFFIIVLIAVAAAVVAGLAGMRGSMRRAAT